MAIQLISVKCPDCGADLSIESGREFAFCSYCGTKVMVANDNEQIIRTIDEAQIKQAETDRMIRMRQMEMEEKDAISRKRLILLWAAATAILGIIGIIGYAIENMGMMICLLAAMLVGMYGGINLFDSDKKKKRPIVGANEILISQAMAEAWGTNYNSAEALFMSAGFNNVTVIPLNDLGTFNLKKNGQVDSVSINGNSEFETDDVFPKSAKVIITYHCSKK